MIVYTHDSSMLMIVYTHDVSLYSWLCKLMIVILIMVCTHGSLYL